MKRSPEYYFSVGASLLLPAGVSAAICIASWGSAWFMSIPMLVLAIACIAGSIAHLWAFKRSLLSRVDNPVTRAARRGEFDGFIDAMKSIPENTKRLLEDRSMADMLYGEPTVKDYTEDFTLENGNYVNRCLECADVFRGHKRRIFCRECANKPHEFEDLNGNFIPCEECPNELLCSDLNKCCK